MCRRPHLTEHLFQLQSRRTTPKQVKNAKTLPFLFFLFDSYFTAKLERDDLGRVRSINRKILPHSSHGVPGISNRNIRSNGKCPWCPVSLIDIKAAGLVYRLLLYLTHFVFFVFVLFFCSFSSISWLTIASSFCSFFCSLLFSIRNQSKICYLLEVHEPHGSKWKFVSAKDYFKPNLASV